MTQEAFQPDRSLRARLIVQARENQIQAQVFFEKLHRDIQSELGRGWRLGYQKALSPTLHSATDLGQRQVAGLSQDARRKAAGAAPPPRPAKPVPIVPQKSLAELKREA